MQVELLCTVKINGEFRHPTEGAIELPDGVAFNADCMVEIPTEEVDGQTLKPKGKKDA